MTADGRGSLRDLLADVSSLPAFPTLPPDRWAEVERRTGEILESAPWVHRHTEGLDACYRYAEALHEHGDECGAEEVWGALVHEAAVQERYDVAAYACARLSRCALDFQELREGLNWGRQGRAWGRHLPPSHPVHRALALEIGLIHQRRQHWEGARRSLVRALAMEAPDDGLTDRWQGLRGGDFAGVIRNALASLALDQARREAPRSAERLLREAKAWIQKNESAHLAQAVQLRSAAILAEVACHQGDAEGARRLVDGWFGTPPPQGDPQDRSRPLFLRLTSLLALADEDLPEAQRRAGQAFQAMERHCYPLWERDMLRDLVWLFTKAHEQRYSGHREHTVLRTLDDGGPWILDLVDLLEARDGYLSGHHARFVRAACLAMCAEPEDRARAGLPEDLDLPYLLGAASLHDLGKLEVSWALLNRVRPRKRVHERRYQAHVLSGARLLEGLGFPMAARLVEEHHERADGLGYPYGTRYQTTAGSLLALAEHLVGGSQPSHGRPRPVPVLETARWCLSEGARHFQPQALAALHRAVEDDGLASLQRLINAG